MTATPTPAPRRAPWTAYALTVMEWIANPALAGLAFCLLALGIVTWLPALAAAAYALQRWRADGEQRCFAITFAVFGAYWRALWRHSVTVSIAAGVLAANMVFLAGQPSAVAFALLAAQVGIATALWVYHLGLAAVAAVYGPQTQPRTWRRAALTVVFGRPRRGLALLAAAVAAPILTLPVAVGPLLLGTTMPLLVALALARRALTSDPERS